MFMNPNGGLPLSPLSGRWQIHNQPSDWKDTDPDILGFFNKNITVTMNVPRGTTYSIVMKAGDETIFHSGGNTDFGFESYPSQWSDGNQLSPSGIDTRLVGLQFVETTIVVREKDYYDQKSVVVVTITFEQQGQKFERNYRLKLSWDDYYSQKPNPLITDLKQLGVPFIGTYKDWRGWQPITGEYRYECRVPVQASVEFNGFWVGCFWPLGQATLQFHAFEPIRRMNGPRIVGRNSIGISLDLCSAGITNATVDISAWDQIEIQRGLVYFLLRTDHGTFVAQYPDFRPWNVYFVEADVTKQSLSNLLSDGKELWSHHDFKNDALGHHRVRIGSTDFWEVLSVDHPSPALGGTIGGSLPISFLYGIMNFIAKYPRWYTRLGSLPLVV